MVSSGVDTVGPCVGVKSRVSTKPTSSSTTTAFEDSARRRPPVVAYVEEDSGHLDSHQPLDEREREQQFVLVAVWPHTVRLPGHEACPVRQEGRTSTSEAQETDIRWLLSARIPQHMRPMARG